MFEPLKFIVRAVTNIVRGELPSEPSKGCSSRLADALVAARMIDPFNGAAEPEGPAQWILEPSNGCSRHPKEPAERMLGLQLLRNYQGLFRDQSSNLTWIVGSSIRWMAETPMLCVTSIRWAAWTFVPCIFIEHIGRFEQSIEQNELSSKWLIRASHWTAPRRPIRAFFRRFWHYFLLLQQWTHQLEH